MTQQAIEDHRFKMMSLYNLKVSVFTDIVYKYGIEVEDLTLFGEVVKSIRDTVKIERAHYEEELEIVKPETDGN